MSRNILIFRRFLFYCICSDESQHYTIAQCNTTLPVPEKPSICWWSWSVLRFPSSVNAVCIFFVNVEFRGGCGAEECDCLFLFTVQFWWFRQLPFSFWSVLLNSNANVQHYNQSLKGHCQLTASCRSELGYQSDNSSHQCSFCAADASKVMWEWSESTGKDVCSSRTVHRWTWKPHSPHRLSLSS